MPKALRLLFMVAILLFVAVAPVLIQPEWARELGLETWCTIIPTSSLPREELRSKEIDERREALNRRVYKKNCVIKDLIDGRITLLETAALFRRWNEDYPQVEVDPTTPGESEEERVCNQVILWVRAQLQWQNPDGAKELAGRLQDELRHHKEEHGGVVLLDGSNLD